MVTAALISRFSSSSACMHEFDELRDEESSHKIELVIIEAHVRDGCGEITAAKHCVKQEMHRQLQSNLLCEGLDSVTPGTAMDMVCTVHKLCQNLVWSKVCTQEQCKLAK